MDCVYKIDTFVKFLQHRQASQMFFTNVFSLLQFFLLLHNQITSLEHVYRLCQIVNLFVAMTISRLYNGKSLNFQFHRHVLSTRL